MNVAEYIVKYVEHRGTDHAYVIVGGAALGWGKASGGVIKNHRPRGLRILWETGETDGIK